ncbi:hypothetical protein [Nitrosospira multiformis]|nr:hypothetical protein [Nitrosospira multiformis]
MLTCLQDKTLQQFDQEEWQVTAGSKDRMKAVEGESTGSFSKAYRLIALF